METVYKSRTQKKKEDQALKRLGEQLVSLRHARLETMGLPQEIVEDIQFARSIKRHGARRRQIKHIGALLRQLDAQFIETILERIQSGAFEK